MATLQRFSARLIAETNINVSVTGVGVVIQGVAVADLDEVVLNGQTVAAENGLYVAHTGSAWTRHTDFDVAGEMLKGTEFYVREGSSDNAGSTWTFDTGGTITVGTTPLRFKRESYGPGAAPTGEGLDRDPLTNQWEIEDISTPTGYFTRVQTDARGRVLDAEESLTEATQIEGLRLVWDAANSLKIEEGSAYVPGSGTVDLELDTFLSSLALTASTWYFCYLFESGGTGALELVTQAPVTVPYRGAARIKGPDGAPDASRRYLGAIRCGPTANTMLRFFRDGDFCRYLIDDDTTTASGGSKVLDAARAKSNTTQSLSALVPPTSRMAFLFLRNLYNTTGGTTVVASAADGLNPAGGTGQLRSAVVTNSTRGQVTGPVVTDTSQQIVWASNAAAIDVWISVLGYWEAR